MKICFHWHEKLYILLQLPNLPTTVPCRKKSSVDYLLFLSLSVDNWLCLLVSVGDWPHLSLSVEGKSDSYEEQVAVEELMTSTLESLNNLLQEILQKDFTARGLDTITKVILCLNSTGIYFMRYVLLHYPGP